MRDLFVTFGVVQLLLLVCGMPLILIFGITFYGRFHRSLFSLLQGIRWLAALRFAWVAAVFVLVGYEPSTQWLLSSMAFQLPLAHLALEMVGVLTLTFSLAALVKFLVNWRQASRFGALVSIDSVDGVEASYFGDYTSTAKVIGCRSVPFLLLARSEITPAFLGYFGSGIVASHTHLEGLSPEQRVAVFAHELAHFRYRDPAWCVLFILQWIVSPLDPILAHLARTHSLLIEQRCDDVAIAKSGMSPKGYAILLLDVQDGKQKRPPSAIYAMAAPAPKELRHRLSAVKSFEERSTRGANPWVGPILVGVCIVGFLGVAYTARAGVRSANLRGIAYKMVVLPDVSNPSAPIPWDINDHGIVTVVCRDDSYVFDATNPAHGPIAIFPGFRAARVDNEGWIAGMSERGAVLRHVDGREIEVERRAISVWGMNRKGAVAGTMIDGKLTPFYWDRLRGTVSIEIDREFENNVANMVNDDGVVTGQLWGKGPYEPDCMWLWRVKEGTRYIDPPRGMQAVGGRTLNNHGVLDAGLQDAQGKGVPVRWSHQKGYAPMQHPYGFANFAIVDNCDLGLAVGCGWTTDDLAGEATMWLKSGAVINLNEVVVNRNGWTLKRGQAVNEFGQIVCMARKGSRSAVAVLFPTNK